MELLTDILRGLLGISVMLACCYALSANRSKINWKLVASGIGLQIVLAILILKVPYVGSFFEIIAVFFRSVLTFSEEGAEFIFGGLVSDTDSFGYIIAFQVLPTIVFFSALSSVLYYLGILQRIIYGVAWLMKRTMRLSGPESLAAAANVFIGQTEAPLVVKPYLEQFTKSELLCLMTGGMATVAGGVFVAYVELLGGGNEQQEIYFAIHLLTASIISAPAAIVAAKMLYPEDQEKDLEDQMKMSGDNSTNLLEAIAVGTTDGLKLAVNVGAMLLVFTALVYMVNQMLIYGPGEWFNLNESIKEATKGRFEGFSFTYILGLAFAPFAWLLGTPTQDILVVGQLLGQKTVINEFYAYTELQSVRDSGIVLKEKSLIIATYALCGFANFASIGIQIGGIGAIAPGQRKTLAEFGIKALIGGTVASFLTAAIAGFLF